MAPDIALRPIGALRHAEDNPRRVDPARLDMVALSLRKLGFVLPIIANRSGEIISGHQRHTAATRLGFDQVPVRTIAAIDDARRRALNIVFNRATNDMRVIDHAPALTRELSESNILGIASRTPDTKTPFRCMDAVPVDTAALATTARPNFDFHMRNMARALWRNAGLLMPVLVTRSGAIVNGVGRIQLASELGWPSVPVVWIEDEEGDFARLMLNYLSMDFDVHTRYADLLRFNSFRRARQVRTSLGTGFTFAIRGARRGEFSLDSIADRRRWIATHGTSIVDFGAGHLHETDMLRSAGITVFPFEPYRLGPSGEIDKPASLASTRTFLVNIAVGRPVDSVFLSSVLNSVPFREDREKIVAICAALCHPKATLFANAMSTSHTNLQAVRGRSNFSERRDEAATFELGYESGIVLGEFMTRPKVQKYHTRAEFDDLLRGAFDRVAIIEDGKTLFGIARGPRVAPDRLRAAIEFEFDLPYPDGSRMNLVAEAIQAFGARLGLPL